MRNSMRFEVLTPSLPQSTPFSFDVKSRVLDFTFQNPADLRLMGILYVKGNSKT